MDTNKMANIPKLIKGLMVGAIGALIGFILWMPGWLDIWEAKTWDWRASLMSRPGNATSDICLILLDQNSLDWAKEENGLTWPWPRELYALIISYCQRNGAKSLAFDVLFTEPSAYGAEDDQKLGAAISEFGRFAAGSVFVGKNSGSETAWPPGLHSPQPDIAGLNQWLSTAGTEDIVFPRAAMPIPEVAKHAAALCNVHMNPDPDGVYRRIKPFAVFDGKTLFSTGFGAYLAAHPGAQANIESGKFILDGKPIPGDETGNVILRYRGISGTHKAYSAAAVLQSEIRISKGEKPVIPAQAFKDKYVFFGFSAPGLYDLRPAPVGGIYTGVEIHATALDNFLSRDFMQTAPLWLTICLILMSALICGVSASFFSTIAGGIAVTVIFLSSPVFLSVGAYIGGFWLPLAVQEAANAGAIALALAVNYATEGRQKRFIKNAFSQYLSPTVIDQLIQHPERLRLGGERRTISIFFSDIQGFTSISEKLDPIELTRLLNEYLSAMTAIILDEGGTIDKYEGDAIVAFWNAPLDVPEHAVKAVRAALLCQKKLADMQPKLRQTISTPLLMRIGVNTGIAVVGNMGSDKRFDYSMMGDAANLAARLEGANKQFGTYTMISQFTLDHMGAAFPVRELAKVAVVGRKEPVIVYEPMYQEQFEEKKELLEKFAEGLSLFYKGQFADARNLFSEIRDADPAAAAYEEKCRMLGESPPKDWQGVWVMTSK